MTLVKEILDTRKLYLHRNENGYQHAYSRKMYADKIKKKAIEFCNLLASENKHEILIVIYGSLPYYFLRIVNIKQIQHTLLREFLRYRIEKLGKRNFKRNEIPDAYTMLLLKERIMSVHDTFVDDYLIKFKWALHKNSTDLYEHVVRFPSIKEAEEFKTCVNIIFEQPTNGNLNEVNYTTLDDYLIDYDMSVLSEEVVSALDDCFLNEQIQYIVLESVTIEDNYGNDLENITLAQNPIPDKTYEAYLTKTNTYGDQDLIVRTFDNGKPKFFVAAHKKSTSEGWIKNKAFENLKITDNDNILRKKPLFKSKKEYNEISKYKNEANVYSVYVKTKSSENAFFIGKFCHGYVKEDGIRKPTFVQLMEHIFSSIQDPPKNSVFRTRNITSFDQIEEINIYTLIPNSSSKYRNDSRYRDLVSRIFQYKIEKGILNYNEIIKERNKEYYNEIDEELSNLRKRLIKEYYNNKPVIKPKRGMWKGQVTFKPRKRLEGVVKINCSDMDLHNFNLIQNETSNRS